MKVQTDNVSALPLICVGDDGLMMSVPSRPIKAKYSLNELMAEMPSDFTEVDCWNVASFVGKELI